jgi:hypothetical protein
MDLTSSWLSPDKEWSSLFNLPSEELLRTNRSQEQVDINKTQILLSCMAI